MCTYCAVAIPFLLSAMMVLTVYGDENATTSPSFYPTIFRSSTSTSSSEETDLDSVHCDASNQSKIVFDFSIGNTLGYKTTWKINEVISGDQVQNGIVNQNAIETQEYCMDKDVCYEFKISNFLKAIISCASEVCFTAYYDDEIVKVGEEGTLEMQSFIFGYCPTITNTPTASPLTCGENEESFQLEFPSENSFQVSSPADLFWQIQDSDGNLLESDEKYDFSKDESDKTYSYCLMKKSCYTFIIHSNDYGAGVSDWVPFTGYKAYFRNSLIETRKGNSESWDFSRSLVFGEHCNPTSCDEDDNHGLISIFTDKTASRISWDITNSLGVVVLSSYSFFYERYTRYKHSFCIPKDDCYDFTMYSTDPVIYLESGKGHTQYKLSFDNDLIKDQKHFEVESESSSFGECFSVFTSSTTPLPVPTSMPFSITTQQSPDAGIISINTFGRRKFPRSPDRPTDTVATQSVPNCTAFHNNVGCVNHPVSIPLYRPQWAGKLHFSPPSCTNETLLENVMKRSCRIYLPMSRKIEGLTGIDSWRAVEDDSTSQFQITNLPSGSNETTIMASDTSIIAADLNNDGLIDIVVGSNSMKKPNQVFYNNGIGFDEPIALPGSNMATVDVKLADLDDNGSIDIVLINYNRNDVVLYNTGNGTFEVYTLSGLIMASTASCLGDVDGDGRIDIVVSSSARPNQIFYNKGNRAFEEGLTLPGGNLESKDIEIGDINNDGLPDLVVANSFQPNQLLVNNGYRSFMVHSLSSAKDSDETTVVELADVDGDSNLDIVFGQVGSLDYIIYNDNGNFEATTILSSEKRGPNTNAIQLADLDGNGLLDVIVCTGDLDEVLYNQGGKKFHVKPLLDSKQKTNSISVIDMDKNGFADILISSQPSDGSLISNQILYNNPDATNTHPIFNAISLRPPEPEDRIYSSILKTADVNNDGHIDVIAPIKYDADKILYNRGDGKLGTPISLPATNDFITNGLVLGDLNDDGWIDIVLGRYGGPNYILYNDGSGNFIDGKQLPGGNSTTTSIQVADMNGDGKVSDLTFNFNFMF